MIKNMTILDFMKMMKDKIPSNMFTKYSMYAEVDPDFMTEFGDDSYGEFNEIDIEGNADVSLAYNWLEKRFKTGKLNSFWPIVSFIFDGKLAIIQPNGMIDNGKFAYDGMTLHEFMMALSSFVEDQDPSKCQIALPKPVEYLIYRNAKVDSMSHNVILSFK